MATDAQVDGLFAVSLVERDANGMAAQVDGLFGVGLVEQDPNPMAAQVDGFFAIALVSRTKPPGVTNKWAIGMIRGGNN